MNHKFSIITPAHKNTTYHKELYDSILAQTYTNWEWILWLNNDIKRDLLPEEFEKDERVIIYETDNTSKNVGYHKHHAFHKGTGDILVMGQHLHLLSNLYTLVPIEEKDSLFDVNPFDD